MVKGTTKSGFKYTANEKVSNDWRFVKAMADVESGDRVKSLRGTVTMVNLLLGDDGEAKLSEFLAEKDGTVPTDKMMSTLAEILTSLNSTKN